MRNYKNTHEIYLPLWLVEDRPKQGKKGLTDGLDWLCYLAGTSMSHRKISISCIFLQSPHQVRECFNTGAVVAQTCRSLGHHLLHLQILRLLVLLKPADFEAQSSLLKNSLHAQIQIRNACPGVTGCIIVK